jgi:hypothetical protein
MRGNLGFNPKKGSQRRVAKAQSRKGCGKKK